MLVPHPGMVPFFNTGGGHRLFLNLRRLKRKCCALETKKGVSRQFKALVLRNISWEDRSFENDYHRLISTLRHCANATEVVRVTQKSRTSLEMKEPEKRREMKPIPHNNKQLATLNKLICCKVKEDFDMFRRTQLPKAVERRKSSRKCRRLLLLHRRMLTSVKFEDG